MNSLNHFVLKCSGFLNEMSATALAAILWSAVQ